MNKDIENQLDALEKSKNEMLSILSQWSEEELNQKPDDKSWSALQVVEHVMGSEKGTLGYMKKKTQASPEDLPEATEENRLASIQLNEVLKSTKRYEKPDVMPEPEGKFSFDQYTEEWNKLNLAYRDFFENLDNAYLDRQVFRHPFSGMLSARQTIDFLINHIAHHIHQLNRIKQAQ
ncbi:DinB family protein [Halocola ammonii]